jgi:hypothetical protein
MMNRKASSTSTSKYREQQVIAVVEIIRRDIHEIGDYAPVGYDRQNQDLWRNMYGITLDLRDLAMEVLVEIGEFRLEVHSRDGMIARRIPLPAASRAEVLKDGADDDRNT